MCENVLCEPTMSNHLQKTIDNCVVLEYSERMGTRVNLRKVFEAFNNRQVEYNWLITDFECTSYPPEFQSKVEWVGRSTFANLGIKVLIAMSDPEVNLGKGKIRL